jgi:hypothetical protein
MGVIVTASRCVCAVMIVTCLGGAAAAAGAASEPTPPGKLVDLGGHKLHVNCTGTGSPTVVVENGLGDFSFDWILVQNKVASFTRVCTYDRAGYAWSDPGPSLGHLRRLISNCEMRSRSSTRGARSCSSGTRSEGR